MEVKKMKKFKELFKEKKEDIESQVLASMSPGVMMIQNRTIRGVPFFVIDLMLILVFIISTLFLQSILWKSISMILMAWSMFGLVVDYGIYKKKKRR
jgi:hypothetical protein